MTQYLDPGAPTVTQIGDEAGNKMAVNSDGSINVAGENFSGTFSPSGLKNGIVVTRLTVTDIPTALPPSPYSNRNTLSIRVIGANTVYFGPSGVTSSNGYPKNQNEEIALDVQANAAVELYGVCATGKTCEVAILEVG